MQKIIEWFKSLFKKQAIPQVKIEHNTPAIPDHEPIKPETIDWDEWTMKAIDISQGFEGSDPWANITGNFDGAYLTCGALGFTWKYNNQPPMILEYVNKHGADKLLSLMPKTGAEYIHAAKLGEQGGKDIVSKWSQGNKVREPYYSELRAFWKSKEMKDIQIKAAWKMMGVFAMNKTLEGQKFFSLESPKFSHFAYWFDQAVLNGTGQTVPFGTRITREFFDYQTKEGQYLRSDFKKNQNLWREIIAKTHNPLDNEVLMIMAWERAKKSRFEFIPVTMCRRGTLAMGEGYVNGKYWKFDWA